MRPVWFKDDKEMECLAKEVSNWTLNWNYWTGGTQQSCWGQWAWCSAQGPDALVQGLRWAQGQPDNVNGTEGCLHLRILQNNTGLAISDKSCSRKYVMACQGVEIVQQQKNSTAATQVCSKVECPTTECKRNVNYFY